MALTWWYTGNHAHDLPSIAWKYISSQGQAFVSPKLCRKRRRARFALLMLIELVAQWINCAFFIIPNAALLARPCDYFSNIVRELFQQALCLQACRLQVNCSSKECCML
jgi:hypothetical protein